MPDEPEIETERVREAIVEELERDRKGAGLLKPIALTTALLAAVAAVAALQSGSAVNTALILKTEATRLQAEASDQWSYYQAKGIKAAIQEAPRGAGLAAGKQPPAAHEAEARRYTEEQKEIKKAAEEKERERDEKAREADHLIHRHHGFASAVALMQVSIALGAVAALTRTRSVWFGSLAVGAAGILLFALALTR
jgi:hypothetical protein